MLKFLLSLIAIFILSCNHADDKLKEQLYGEWEKINPHSPIGTVLTNGEINMPPPVGYDLPQGIAFGRDSLEFFQGIFKSGRDKITQKIVNKYLGSFTPYKIHKGEIIVFNPRNKKWEQQWKFSGIKNDTLFLVIDDSVVLKYKKLHYDIDAKFDFDQIIYSSSGGYGSFPILDISIKKNGDVLFQGEGYTEPLGFYSAKASQKRTSFVFEKFKKARPLRLSNNYLADHTDDEEITTTFVKNGKIIKTITDYGKRAPKDLLWAYVPLGNLHNIIHLNILPEDALYYPKLKIFTFLKNNKRLALEKSESFYLWTELKKSSRTERSFEPLYELRLRPNSVYSGPDPNKSQPSNELQKVLTDGQIFKFLFKNRQPVSYDLGYNFINRNFNPEDFRDEQ